MSTPHPLIVADLLSDLLYQFAPIGLMLLVAYFLLIQPMSKENQAKKERLAKLDKGDQVVLEGGLIGRVSSLEEKIAVVELADKVKVKVLRSKISDLASAALGEDDKTAEAKPKAGKAKDGG